MKFKLGMVYTAVISINAQKAEAGGFQVQDQPEPWLKGKKEKKVPQT
jgi:hypothetical protein